MSRTISVSKEFYLGAGLIDMTFPLSITWYSGICGAKFSKKSGFDRKFEGIDCGVGAAASSIKARSFVVLNPPVKEIACFLGRGEPLIF